MNAPVANLTPAAELHANVSVPFDSARAMPKSVYTSAEFLAQEQQHIFSHDWLCAGRAETLAALLPGTSSTVRVPTKAEPLSRDDPKPKAYAPFVSVR